MKPIEHVHITDHVRDRAWEYGIDLSVIREILARHETRVMDHHGRHGGVAWKFFRTVDARPLCVVAELKGNE